MTTKVKLTIATEDGEVLEQIVVHSCYDSTTLPELRREILQAIDKSPHLVLMDD